MRVPTILKFKHNLTCNDIKPTKNEQYYLRAQYKQTAGQMERKEGSS